MPWPAYWNTKQDHETLKGKTSNKLYPALDADILLSLTVSKHHLCTQ